MMRRMTTNVRHIVMTATVLLATVATAWSGNVTFKARLDSATLLMGKTTTLHLEITNAAHTELYDTACNSYVWNGEVLSQSGDYHDTLSAANGCDSVATLHLTIHPVYALTEQRGVCEDELPTRGTG